MKLEVKIQLLKFCSQVLNAIFLALGLSVAGCAFWILFDSGSLQTVLPSVELRTVGAGLLLIGGLVVLVSLIGCVGADRENRFLLVTYMAFLIVLVLGQLFVTLLLLINRNKIEQSLDQTVKQFVLQYGQSSDSQDRLMDNVQIKGKCCGITDPSDWLQNSHIQSLNLTNPDVLPCSCFSSFNQSSNSSWCSELQSFTSPQYGRGNSSYDQGCNETFYDWLQENALTIVSMDISLIFIQVLQFVVMVYLYQAFGTKAALKRTSQLSDSDHAHLDLDQPELDYRDPDDGYIDPTPPEHYHDYQNHVDHTHLAYHHDNQSQY
ncbi:CD82 antigen [Larimichthys crocea]|uniref:CD82 antigen n=1 Tax=Larimichthys crocea TaxID=215358 RepID=UPI00054C09CF|nr:CD82 antigen-like [Larimichthys crocea]TMS01247.1 CD82 antigen [Larimichthys crocea]